MQFEWVETEGGYGQSVFERNTKEIEQLDEMEQGNTQAVP